MGTFQIWRPAEHKRRVNLAMTSQPPLAGAVPPIGRAQKKQPMAGYVLEKKHYASHTVFIKYQSTFGHTCSLSVVVVFVEILE